MALMHLPFALCQAVAHHGLLCCTLCAICNVLCTGGHVPSLRGGMTLQAQLAALNMINILKEKSSASLCLRVADKAKQGGLLLTTVSCFASVFVSAMVSAEPPLQALAGRVRLSRIVGTHSTRHHYECLQ